MKRALVLNGGGSRGAYEIGAWQALDELGVRFDGVYGTSIGALNAAFFAQGDLDGALAQYRGETMFRSEFTEEETRRLIDTARAVCGDDCEITIDTMSGHFWNYKIDPRAEDQSWGNSIYTDFSDFHGRCLKMCVEIFEPLKAKELQDRLGECDCVRFSEKKRTLSLAYSLSRHIICRL